MAKLPHQIDGVLRVEWGINDSAEGKHAGFTHGVMVTLRDEGTRWGDLPHPATCLMIYHDASKCCGQKVISPLLGSRLYVVLDNGLLWFLSQVK